MSGPGALTVLMRARSGGRVAPVRLRTRLAQGDQRGAHGGAQRADSGGVLLIGDGTASAQTLAFLPLVTQARAR